MGSKNRSEGGLKGNCDNVTEYEAFLGHPMFPFSLSIQIICNFTLANQIF